MTTFKPILLAALMLVLSACRPDPQTNPPETVVLYTSTDDEFAKLVVNDFTTETGIQVKVVGDTEATKTTGLVARLKSEATSPNTKSKADVWWSSEPFGTIDLARSGVLEPGAMKGLAPTTNNHWPESLHDPDWTWIGLASRPRVIVYATDRITDPPSSLREFANPKWKGRVGMARPQFGTTRGHMGILAARWGLPEFERWLTMLNANNIRLYDGNATVVRAIAMGEIDLGLTDADDVWAGQRNGWKVGCTYEPFDPPMILSTQSSKGPTLLPNTVAIIANAPNPDNAKRLASYLISLRVERLLAESTSRNLPVNPELKELFNTIAPKSLTASDPNRLQSQPIYPNFSDAYEMIPQALDACDRILN